MGCAERRRDWGHGGARLWVWNETDREERKRASDAEMCSKPMSRRNQNTTRRPGESIDGWNWSIRWAVLQQKQRSGSEAWVIWRCCVAVVLSKRWMVVVLPSANLAAPGILVR